MRVFYWILASFGGVFAVCTLVSFSIGIAFDNEVWLGRARRFRHWLWLIILFGFNFWVWGSVAYTLIHWHTG
jgi:hypothetical protein